MRILTAILLLSLLPFSAMAGDFNYDYLNIGYTRSSESGLDTYGPNVAVSARVCDYFAFQGSFSYLSTGGYNIGTLFVGGSAHMQVMQNLDILLTVGLIHPNANVSTPTGTTSVGKSSGLVGLGLRAAPFDNIELDAGYIHYRTDIWQPGSYYSVNTYYGTALYNLSEMIDENMDVFLSASHTSEFGFSANALTLGMRFNF